MKYLLLVMFLIFGLPVIIADCVTHKIPNIYTLLLAYITSIHILFVGVNHLHVISTAIAFLGLLNMFGLGMGDLKIILLLVLFSEFSTIHDLLIFLCAIFSLAFMQFLVIRAFTGHWKSNLALAPSIFFASALYLGA